MVRKHIVHLLKIIKRMIDTDPGEVASYVGCAWVDQVSALEVLNQCKLLLIEVGRVYGRQEGHIQYIQKNQEPRKTDQVHRS